MFETIGNLIGNIAPTVATALAGPLAGSGVKVLVDALGLTEGASEKEIEARLNSLTPEDIIKIREQDRLFQKDLHDKQIDLASLVVEDRKSARNREILTGDSGTPKLIAIMSFSTFVFCLVGTFGLFFAAFYIPDVTIPAELGYLLGSMTSASGLLAKTCCDYYMGSSSSSDQTSNMLFHSTPNGFSNRGPLAVAGLIGQPASSAIVDGATGLGQPKDNQTNSNNAMPGLGTMLDPFQAMKEK